MKASELRDKTIEELEQQLVESCKEQFNCRMQKSTGQLTKPHLLKDAAKDIARIKTVLKEKAGSSNE